MKNVLIHCTGNSCRSRIAEGLWQAIGNGAWQAHSLCSSPNGDVHPLAIRAMKEIDIDISSFPSSSINEFRSKLFDLVISIGDSVVEMYSTFPDALSHLQWSIDDPSVATGTDEEQLVQFRCVREELRDRINRYMTRRKPSVLFIDIHNACRSQMAEGILRNLADDRFEALSAGMRPTKVHPGAIDVMSDIGIDISQQRSKCVSEYLAKIPVDYPIVVSRKQEQFCPSVWPFSQNTLHWPFDNAYSKYFNWPLRDRLLRVRDQIYERISIWLNEFEQDVKLSDSAGQTMANELRYTLWKA